MKTKNVAHKLMLSKFVEFSRIEDGKIILELPEFYDTENVYDNLLKILGGELK
jgi:hypothetical protein